MQIEIKSIVIKLGEKDIELSIESARELYNQLHELFKDKAPNIIIDRPIYPNPVQPWPVYPTAPQWPDRNDTPWTKPEYPIVYCRSGSDVTEQ